MREFRKLLLIRSLEITADTPFLELALVSLW